MSVRVFGLLFLISWAIITSCSKDEPAPIVEPDPPLSSQRNIFRFDVNGSSDDVTVLIDTTLATVTISVPFDYDVTSVVPIIFISDFATISPESLTEQDFSSPVLYTVESESGLKKVFTVSITRRAQLPITNLGFVSAFAGSFPSNCEWGDTLYVTGDNFIEFLKHSDGTRVLNDVYLVHATTLVSTKFSVPYARFAKEINSDYTSGLSVVIPDDFPIGEYIVKAGAMSELTQASHHLMIHLPDPVFTGYPRAMKVGDVVEIQGKYFTNIPRGNNDSPKIRVYKTTNLNTYTGEEFEIISYTETSITARVKGFSDNTGYIVIGESYLSYYSRRGFFTFSGYNKVTLTE